MRRKFKNIFYKVILVFTILIFSNELKSQDYSPPVTILNKFGVKIELQLKLSTNPCGVNNKNSRFALFITNADKIYTLNKYLNWKMDIVNCKGVIIEKIFSIDLSQNLSEGLNKSLDWEFEGNQIEQDAYEIINSQFANYSKDKIKSKAISEKPNSIIGQFKIITGQQTKLSINGGYLTKDATWVWYSGSCSNGINIGYGSSIIVSPNISTKYFVRAEGKSYKTECISAEVIIDNDSKAADGVLGKSKVCKGDNKDLQLKVIGGELGYQANWVWYEGSCGSNPIGTGEVIIVKFKKTSTYFVRAEGANINPTSCVSWTVELVDPPIMPDQIIIKENKQNICEGDVIYLEPVGGKINANSNWVWYSQEIGQRNKNLEGEGNILKVSPFISTKYFIQAKGTCNISEEIFVSVNVIQKSISPNSISLIKINNELYTFRVAGGKLGEGAKWVWYKEGCGLGKLSTGEEITVKANKTIKIYVRAEGQCNPTECVESIAFGKTKAKTKFGFINAGVVANDPSDISNGVFTIGSQLIYLRLKINLKFSKDGHALNPEYESDGVQLLNYPINSGTFYQFNGKLFSKRTSYTMGFMFGGKVLRFYLGGGYGENKQIWGVDVYDNSNVLLAEKWANNNSQSIKGPEGEAGLFLKMKGFNLMGGVSVIYSTITKEKYFDGHIGVGFSF